MGTTALIISISYLVVVVVGVALGLALARSTRRKQHEADTAVLAHRERQWLVIVVVLLVSLLFSTIFFIPYGTSSAANTQVVNVEAQQFGWLIDPPTVKAGTPVEFRLSSRDVNHGFGVFNEDDVLLFQVQVMPGRIQATTFTFDKPGTYEILCMEFCGVGHHLMTGRFEVTPA